MITTTIKLKVLGMTSEHCANAVQNLIIDERSVENVEVFWKTGSVQVHGTEKMNRDNIVNSVNLSGVYHVQ